MIQTQVNCGECGFEFSLLRSFVQARQRDGKKFSCPNGHRISWSPSQDEKRIAELEKEAARHKDLRDRAEEDRHREYNMHSDTIAALRSCPLVCGWRSRKVVKRWSDDDAFQRGLIRVRADVVAHLADEHGVNVDGVEELVEELAR